jgi:hypothetical protein
LTHEGDDFWSGQYSFATATGTTAVEYKFLKGSDGWESNDNRTALVTQDNTLDGGALSQYIHANVVS